ncbi:aspartic proteinase nepenthesin-1-like [Macadamia integrifolia]|uniref:aspartic proteinase nepenthesin-1-like n=1 Tax=Macadamia integrifolia TaxID=60698 RepID=UPI001C529870|nr:aspartic proteinase nepenthesin-1-like [Macadamia integrifolia]
MDTGSHTTWVQCEGCNPCFSLIQTPNFPFQRSQSYRSIPCGHQECPTPREACYGSSCGFKARYGSSVGPSTRETIAKETLTFSSDRLGDTELHDNIFLACGLENQNIRFPQPNKIAGVLGLGPGGPGTSPIWSQVLKKRFSYCLAASEQTSSRLHIGEGARMVGPQVVSTPLVKGANPSLYYVGLKDIGIAGTRLRIQGLYAGGCIIDTGAPYSSLLPNAYAMVRNGFIQYFAQFGMQPYGNGSRPSDLPRFDLCFPRTPPGFRFPTMTFHFRGADLVVQPTSVFVVGANFICVALKSSDKKTMLGAYQQTQHEFSFDLEIGNRGTLFFAPNNCGAPT